MFCRRCQLSSHPGRAAGPRTHADRTATAAGEETFGVCMRSPIYAVTVPRTHARAGKSRGSSRTRGYEHPPQRSVDDPRLRRTRQAATLFPAAAKRIDNFLRSAARDSCLWCERFGWAARKEHRCCGGVLAACVRSCACASTKPTRYLRAGGRRRLKDGRNDACVTAELEKPTSRRSSIEWAV